MIAHSVHEVFGVEVRHEGPDGRRDVVQLLQTGVGAPARVREEGQLGQFLRDVHPRGVDDLPAAESVQASLNGSGDPVPTDEADRGRGVETVVGDLFEDLRNCLAEAAVVGGEIGACRRDHPGVQLAVRDSGQFGQTSGATRTAQVDDEQGGLRLLVGGPHPLAHIGAGAERRTAGNHVDVFLTGRRRRAVEIRRRSTVGHGVHDPRGA